MKKYAVLLFVFALSCGPSSKMSKSPGIPVRDLLCAGQKPPVGFAAYGYVLFPRNPINNDTNRIRIFLQYFNSTFLPYEGIAPKSNLMVTYWLLKGQQDNYLHDINHVRVTMDIMQNDYDHARAYEMASSIKMIGTRGPILVVWETPYENQGTNHLTGKYFVADFSKFSNDDLDRAVQIWQKILNEGDYDSYSNKFLLLTENYRSLCLKYGGVLTDYITNHFMN
jgi:hypothetical protein